MDKKSIILFVLLFATVAVFVALTYYRVMVRRDYIVSVEVDCDPAVEQCFVAVCDPAEDETCSENPDEQTYYYKIINKNVRNIIPCDWPAEECPALACAPGEAECEEIFCDESAAAAGEVCSDPTSYRE